MRLKHILWPWGQLIDMERSTAEAEQRARKAELMANGFAEDLRKVAAELRTTASALSVAEAVIREQKIMLRGAHFRNPETGRIGPKGKHYRVHAH